MSYRDDILIPFFMIILFTDNEIGPIACLTTKTDHLSQRYVYRIVWITI